MVPFNRPIPESKPQGKVAGGIGALVQAEKAVQIALVLPSAVVICWLIGAWADHRFHQSWIGIAGVIFGSVSGLVYVIRMALTSDKNPMLGGSAKDGNDKGNQSRNS
jgi:F0F1-type ATP synthase assembly protein I